MSALRDVLVLIVQVLGGDIVNRHLARGHLRNIRRLGVLHSLDRIGFESVALFHQFLHAFGVGVRDIRYLLNVARLPG